MKKQPEEKVVESVDKGRRAFVKKVIVGTAFAVPVVQSFSMEGFRTPKAKGIKVVPPPS
jgi:hypothetical protein